MASDRSDLWHRTPGACKMNDRCAAQVHKQQTTFDAVLPCDLFDACLSADLREDVPEIIGFVGLPRLFADDVNRSALSALVQRTRVLGQNRHLTGFLDPAAVLLRPAQHRRAPALVTLL